MRDPIAASAMTQTPQTLQELLRNVRHQDPQIRHGAMLQLVRRNGRRIIDPCLAALKDRDERIRGLAAEFLGEHPTRRAVGPLISSLRDPAWSVTFKAIQTLGSIGDPQAIQPLLRTAMRKGEMLSSHIAVNYISQALLRIGRLSLRPAMAALKHRHPRVRVVAAATLARLNDRRATQPLLPLLTDPDKDVRKSARAAIAQFGRLAVTPLLIASRRNDLHVKGWREEVGQRALALVGIGPQAVSALLRASRDKHVNVRKSAIAALGELRDPRALISLIKALNDSVPESRWQSAIALGKLGDRRASEALITALQDRHPRVREESARAFWTLKDRRAVPSLIQALEDASPHVCWAAAGALGTIEDRRAVEPLCQLLERRAASSKGWKDGGGPANALGILGDRRAVGPLIVALHHPHAETRWGAALALGRLKDRRAVGPLIAVLKSRHPEAPKGAALMALGQIGDRRAITPILATYRRIRNGPALAVKALAEIQGAQALPFVMRSLRHEQTRSHAEWALEQLPVKAIAEELTSFLESDERSWRFAAAETLVKIRHPRAVEFLLKQLDSGELESRKKALELLGHVRTRRVVRRLIDALHGDASWEATQALEQIGRLAVVPLLKVLDSSETAEIRAAEILGKIGDVRAVPALIRALNSDEEFLRGEAAEALSRIRDPRATKALMRALRKGDLKVITAAHRFFIRQGNSGSEPLLIHALKRESRYSLYSEEMAYAFVHAGNPRLAAAGRAWNRSYGPSAPEHASGLFAQIFGENLEAVQWGKRQKGLET